MTDEEKGDVRPGILYGPAGWSYPDWKGIVYPGGMKEHPLNFLERWFDMVEINTTFYHIPALKMVEQWCLTPKRPEFCFILKLGRNLTHGRTDVTKKEKDEFREVFRLVRFYERLGGVLVQFPWSFVNIGQNNDYLFRLLGEYSEFPLIVELRHSSWLKRGFFEEIHRRGVAYCNIDQPAAANSVGLTDYVTSEIGYLRLHGRNAEAWFDRNTGRDRRYDYLYDAGEVREIGSVVERISKKGKKVFVVGNNHYKGQAVVNLLQIRSAVEGKKIPMPEGIIRTYGIPG
jgi:uncharacterized protein YecE (DUF72 family)